MKKSIDLSKVFETVGQAEKAIREFFNSVENENYVEIHIKGKINRSSAIDNGVSSRIIGALVIWMFESKKEIKIKIDNDTKNYLPPMFFQRIKYCDNITLIK